MAMLREFHTRMTAEIFACRGTVDKYIGDEIFAVFGLPTVSADDAANALTCADLMLRAIEKWNVERTDKGEAPLAIGIGLNYGPAVLGDIGSEQSMSFTVIGDTVNTGARLQALTRTLGTPFVIGDSLVAAVRAVSRNLQPGWWTVAGSGRALLAGSGGRGSSLDPQDRGMDSARVKRSGSAGGEPPSCLG